MTKIRQLPGAKIAAEGRYTFQELDSIIRELTMLEQSFPALVKFGLISGRASRFYEVNKAATEELQNGIDALFTANVEKNEKGEPLFKYFTYAIKIPREVPELETKRYGWETDRCKWFKFGQLCCLPNLHYGVRALIRNGSLEKLTEGK